MSATWIVAANASRARIFSQAEPSRPLEEIRDLVDEAVRLRAAETRTDRLGSMAAAKGTYNVGAATPGSTYQPAQTPEEHETENFARQLSACLLEAWQEGRFGKLQLAASPQFLGVLRGVLDAHVKAVIELEINKDYTQSSAAELRERLRAHAGGA